MILQATCCYCRHYIIILPKLPLWQFTLPPSPLTTALYIGHYMSRHNIYWQPMQVVASCKKLISFSSAKGVGIKVPSSFQLQSTVKVHGLPKFSKVESLGIPHMYKWLFVQELPGLNTGLNYLLGMWLAQPDCITWPKVPYYYGQNPL